MRAPGGCKNNPRDGRNVTCDRRIQRKGKDRRRSRRRKLCERRRERAEAVVMLRKTMMRRRRRHRHSAHHRANDQRCARVRGGHPAQGDEHAQQHGGYRQRKREGSENAIHSDKQTPPRSGIFPTAMSLSAQMRVNRNLVRAGPTNCIAAATVVARLPSITVRVAETTRRDGVYERGNRHQQGLS